MQLGEVKNSFGFGGTAKAAESCKFKNYGCKFGVGDVVGAYLVFIEYYQSPKITRDPIFFLSA